MKSKFFKSSILLIIGGFITKILGLFIKIVYTRIIREEGVSLFSLVAPTYSLLITIATLNMPIVISKIIAENEKNKKTIIFTSCFIVLFLNLILVIATIILSKYIALNWLKEAKAYYLLIACASTLPFVSISSIIKGYFFGKQQMLPNVISNIIEQIVRIVLIITILPIIETHGMIKAVSALILFNIISELSSIGVYFFFLPHNFKMNLKQIKPELNTSKEILRLSIPSVSSRLAGNIGYFLEPIVLINTLTKKGLTSEFVIRNYGIYNSYSLALLLMPSFLIMAISTALLPEISKLYSQHNKKKLTKRLKESLIVAFTIGIGFSIFILIFRNKLLYLLYRTKSGSDFIKVLAPVFVLFYLESPLTNFLLAANKAKWCLINTTLGVCVKLLSIIFFAHLNFGIYSLIYSEIINIILVVTLSLIETHNVLNKI